MPNEENPYQSPKAEASPFEGSAASQLTPIMIESLKTASPWIRFMSIIGFIGAGCMFLAGLIFLFAGGAAATAATEFVSSTNRWMGIFGSGVVGIIYMALGVVIFFPARFLFNFGSALRNFTLAYNNAELERAFVNNKMYWKFQGIFTIVCIASVPVLIIAAAVIAVAAM